MYGLEVVFICRVSGFIVERMDRVVYIKFFKMYLRNEILLRRNEILRLELVVKWLYLSYLVNKIYLY